MLVNGDISAETLKSYAEVFVNNDLNYAFVGKTAKNLNDDEIGITETYSTASSTVFDSVIVLSDGKEILPDAIDFAEMSYNHKKPVVITEEAKNVLQSNRIDLDAPGVVVSSEPQAILDAFKRYRYFDRK